MANENTGTIAPHEGDEIGLVLGGVKPLASIEHGKNPELYATAILMGLAGLLRYRVGPTVDCADGEVVFCLPHNKHVLDEYDALRQHGVKDYGIKEYHRRMGRLYGYSEADIEAFIESDIDCDCDKCRGGSV